MAKNISIVKQPYISNGATFPSGYRVGDEAKVTIAVAPGLTLQWYKSVTLSDGQSEELPGFDLLTGATNEILTYAVAADTDFYDVFMCTVTDANGTTVRSNHVKLQRKLDETGPVIVSSAPAEKKVAPGNAFVVFVDIESVEGNPYHAVAVKDDMPGYGIRKVEGGTIPFYFDNFEEGAVYSIEVHDDYTVNSGVLSVVLEDGVRVIGVAPFSDSDRNGYYLNGVTGDEYGTIDYSQWPTAEGGVADYFEEFTGDSTTDEIKLKSRNNQRLEGKDSVTITVDASPGVVLTFDEGEGGYLATDAVLADYLLSTVGTDVTLTIV